MADESGASGGTGYSGVKRPPKGSKKYSRKRKTGVRKSSQLSNMFSPQSGLGGLLGIGGSPVPQGGVNNDLLGLLTGASAKPMVKNMQDHIKGITGSKTPAGGYNMQKVEPPTTMRPKPADALDNGATGDDGYDPAQQALDYLTSLMTQPGAGFDYETAQREAANAIRQSYGAEINAIRQNNRVARKSSKHARKEIEHLYKGLSKMYGKQEAKATRRGEKAADAQMGIAEEGNTILQDLNNSMIQDETTMLQNLGQEQAAGELISPDYDRMGKQVADNTEMGTNAASRALRQGENNARWFDRAQGGARLEGTNAQADMIAQLQAYLMDNRNQIAGLRGDRAQEVAASNLNIQSQAAEATSANQGEMFDQGLDIVKFLLDQEKTERVQDRADANFRWDKKMDRKELRLKMLDAAESGDTEQFDNYSPGIRDAMSIIAEQRDPNDKAATNALWKLFASGAWQDGEIPTDDNSGQTKKLTPYRAAALARKKGIEMGLKGKELSDFVNAAAASV